MQKLTITGIWRNTTDKQGNPFKSAKGFPYTKLSFKCKEHGDRYIGGFGNKENEGWQVGDIVEVIVKENGQYLNFEMPKKEDINNERLEALEKRILKLEQRFDSKFANLEMDIRLEKTDKFLSDKEYNRIKDDYSDIPESRVESEPF